MRKGLLILAIITMIISSQCQSLNFLGEEEILHRQYIKTEKKTVEFNYHDELQTYKLSFGENTDKAPAYATYTKTLLETGWDTLAISSYQGEDQIYSDDAKAFAMGYLEGYLTSDRIWNHYQNLKTYTYNATEMTENDRTFFNQNLEWMKRMALENKNKDDYWLHVYTVIRQMEGIVSGYNSVVEESKKLTYAEFQIINAAGDISEVKYWNSTRPNFHNMTVFEVTDFIEDNSHCSALIKAAADFSDVWFGHNTWTTFSSTMRIFKEYRFKSNNKSEKSKTVAFSGYPGVLSSIDDFYITDKDLYVTETTNQVFNTKLYDQLTPKSLLTWIRTIVANRLADNGKTWTEVFAKYNSGTYNNQFQILDLKLIDTDNKVISDNALWIIEQIPGYTESADVTNTLRYGYWPSYNSAYFKKVRDMSGYNEQLIIKPELKDSIDYDGCVRANIFRRDQFKVDSLSAFKKILRYNDYKNDPLSKSNPSFALACRGDLDANKPNCRGAIDAKVASIKDIKGLSKKKITIVSGPTNDIQVPFDTTNAKCAAQARYVFNGLPKKFEFAWTEYYTTLFE